MAPAAKIDAPWKRELRVQCRHGARDLKSGAVPVQGGGAGSELLDAADVEFHGAVVAAEAAGAVEEGEGFIPELLAVIDDAFPEEVAAVEGLLGEGVAGGEQLVDLLAAAILLICADASCASASR